MSAERKVRASMRRKIFMNSYPNIFTFTVSADTGVSALTPACQQILVKRLYLSSGLKEDNSGQIPWTRFVAPRILAKAK